MDIRVSKNVNILLSGIAIFILCVTGVGRAEEGEEKAKKDKKQLMQEAKAELNNTIWSIELRQMATGAHQKKKQRTEKDTLRFANSRVESEKLASEGFTPTSYTVRLKGQENEVVIWETMQTSEEKGLAFWRGEIRNDTMRGVLSWHLDKKEKEDYTFVSMGKEIIPEKVVTEEEEKEVAPAVQEIKQPEEAPVEIEIEAQEQPAEGL